VIGVPAEEVRRPPICVQHKGLGLYGAELSRKDSAKVAQYEVLGNEVKRQVRPAGTIETLGFWFRARLSDCQHLSIVPSRTETL
jgi:hypothetical protein